jgi:hypothetical protein
MTNGSEPFWPITTTLPSGLRLRRCDRRQADLMREDIADLYVESHRAAVGSQYQGREVFLARPADATRQRGFTPAMAEAQSLVVFCFGFPVSRDGSWWLGFV